MTLTSIEAADAAKTRSLEETIKEDNTLKYKTYSLMG